MCVRRVSSLSPRHIRVICAGLRKKWAPQDKYNINKVGNTLTILNPNCPPVTECVYVLLSCLWNYPSMHSSNKQYPQKNIKARPWAKDIWRVVIKCSNWGAQSAECTWHMHAGRLIFHRSGHGNFNVLQEKKNAVCLHSCELIGQTRPGVAPAWIIWTEKKAWGEHFTGEYGE